ncbi:MAG: indole-3-glycerol phosphate synthase TrpC [Simkania sp.]|nr:indole-3-glycerol phosphate synthase TrpC [Simkania sp.]
MENLLEKILKYKEQEVNALKEEVAANPDHPIHEILDKGRPFKKRFFEASLKEPGLAVIAEVKRKSPSEGTIGEIPSAADLAILYAEGGAAAISVLTDGPSFGGSLADLEAVREKSPLPLLRKDFTIDPIQIAEAAVSGANAVLIIVAAVKDKTKALIQEAERMGMEALVEVTNEEELTIAVAADARIIGVNNRDLKTFKVDIQTALKLKSFMPDYVASVAASGIKGPEDAKKMREAGYDAILVGQSIVESNDPRSYIKQLRGLE